MHSRPFRCCPLSRPARTLQSQRGIQMICRLTMSVPGCTVANGGSVRTSEVAIACNIADVASGRRVPAKSCVTALGCSE